MSYDYDAIIGKSIKKLRENKELTQNQLVVKLQLRNCEITRSALAKIEAGQRHIYSWEIKVIKECLCVKYEDLFL